MSVSSFDCLIDPRLVEQFDGTREVFKYLRITEEDEISWALIQAAVSSIAQTTIITMQDVLGLDSSARMNIPATQHGNWSWRIPNSTSFDSLEKEALRLREMLSMYGRK
ncbi:hypothetical protein GOBAR_DD23768 [Gossypium barbadense]|nr:hypothetical protein GOBAR_DD23768 [Gossypium barbadense]